jgi:putative PIN family toxin of toxin-antitoxin system
MKVVLDTNVLVSSLLTNGPPAAIVDLVAEGKLTPFYDDFIIGEYWRVLVRPKFNLNPSQVSRLIGDIVRIGIAVEANIPNITPMPDEEDRKFYNVAKSSGAFLITGNVKHFPSELFIVTPTDFLRIQMGTKA